MPSLQELTNLLGVLPEVPILPSRSRSQLPQGSSRSTNSSDIDTQLSTPVSRVWMLIRRLVCLKTDHMSSRQNIAVNPFVALKAGKKAIIIAAVDMGSISFFKFGQGDFCEWPMV